MHRHPPRPVVIATPAAARHIALAGILLGALVIACAVGPGPASAPTRTPRPVVTQTAAPEATAGQATSNFTGRGVQSTAVLPTAGAPIPTRTPELPTETEAPEDTQAPGDTPVPPDTETPVPVAGDVIYSSGDACDWGTFALNFNEFQYTENYVFQDQNNQLYLEVPETYVAAYALCQDFGEVADVQMDVDASNIKGPNTNNVSLVCRYNDGGWYEAAITSGGYWYIYKFTNQAGYAELATGASFAINLQRATNRLTMLCVGQDFTLYVNGTQLGSASDAQFETGAFGLSVSTFDIGGAGVAFQSMEVKLP